MAYNPNAIFISHSIISDFEKCPQRYYFQSVYRTSRGYKIQIINPQLALGEAVHDTLEQFLKLLPVQRNKDELMRIFDWNWQNFTGEKGGFLSSTEEKDFKERAISMLERFLKNRHFLETEGVKIKEFPQADLGDDLILTGRFDWVEKEGDTYHIIDFKTGKNEEKEDSLQLPIYAVLLSKMLRVEKIKTSYWYLDKDEEVTPFDLPDLTQTLSELKQKGEIIKLFRQTNSFRCKSGGESCYACRDLLAVVQGKGKLVSMNSNRRQEVYIITGKDLLTSSEPAAPAAPANTPVDAVEDLPF